MSEMTVSHTADEKTGITLGELRMFVSSCAAFDDLAVLRVKTSLGFDSEGLRLAKITAKQGR